MRTKFKRWAVDYIKEHPEICLEKIDAKQDFFKRPLYIEFGSGKGDFILGYSAKYPNASFLAVEKVPTVAGMMAKKLQDNKVNNVLVFPGDAIIVFDELRKGSVEAIFLNFSDPWPKKRHEKRRLTHISFLERYYDLLKKSGRVYIKTDNDGLYPFTLEEVAKSKFKLISNEPNYVFDEENDSMSEYEKKFRELGQAIHRIVLEK